MRTLLITLILICTLSVKAQDNRLTFDYIVKVITERVDGYIYQTPEQGDSKDYWIYLIKTASYYDFDLVRAKIAYIVFEYSDMHVGKAWERTKDMEYTFGILHINSDGKRIPMLIYYWEKDNLLGISMEKQ
jgi:hypothetical protein